MHVTVREGLAARVHPVAMRLCAWACLCVLVCVRACVGVGGWVVQPCNNTARSIVVSIRTPPELLANVLLRCERLAESEQWYLHAGRSWRAKAETTFVQINLEFEMRRVPVLHRVDHAELPPDCRNIRLRRAPQLQPTHSHSRVCATNVRRSAP